jgi:formylglycine-generating enzyme required for sulfatase activity
MNFKKTDIESTTAIGIFPSSSSPYGVEELSGNVWEWTVSLWGKSFRS